MLIVGHRGDPAHHPDNSLAGFRAAARVADMAELDVRRTADGTPVLSHDPAVGGRHLIELDGPEATALEPVAGHPLISLDALLADIGDFPLNIEIKNHPHEPDYDSTHRFAVTVARMARPGDLITCFDWPTVDSVKAAVPAVRTGLLVDAGDDLAGAFGAARSGGHSALAVHWTLMAGRAVEVVDDADGLDIYVWTVNDPTVATMLAAAGTTGIITDHPAAMRATTQEQT